MHRKTNQNAGKPKTEMLQGQFLNNSAPSFRKKVN
jgi:hypothetical protein